MRDPHDVLRRHRDVPSIEERVELLCEQEPVLHVVALRSEVRLDVRGVEHALSVLAGDRTPPAVGLEQPRAEGALALACSLRCQHEGSLVGGDELEGRRVELRGRRMANPSIEQLRARSVGLGFPLKDIGLPAVVGAPRDPSLLGPEGRDAQHIAADEGAVRAAREQIHPTVPADALEEAKLVGVAVPPSEELAREIEVQETEDAEESLPRDGVERMFETEEDWLARR